MGWLVWLQLRIGIGGQWNGCFSPSKHVVGFCGCGIDLGTGFVDPWAAVLIGLLAGFVGFFGITFVKNSFGYDDTLDAFGIHGIGGTVGAILTGVFADKQVGGVSGLINGDASLVWKQIVAVLFTVAFAAIGTFLLAKITEVIAAPLRLTPEEESKGYDTLMHDLTVES